MTSRRALLVLAYVFISCFTQVVAAQDLATLKGQVLERLDDQDRWLGTGERGQKWRAWLRNDSLRDQLRGDAPDFYQLSEVLSQYERSGIQGLDATRFERVRGALRRLVGRADKPALVDVVQTISTDDTHADPQETLDQARQQLQEQLAELDAYLATGGENGAAWQEYLLWDLLAAQLAAGTEADIRVLTEIARRYRSGYEGLELNVFYQTGQALEAYIDALTTVKLPNPAEVYQQQVELLTAAAADYAQEPSGDNYARIFSTANWLQRRRQARQTRRYLADYFGHPNLVAYVNEEFLRVAFRDDVMEPIQINEHVEGSWVTGSGKTVGRLELDLRPSEDEAVLNAIFSGNMSVRTLAVNGPARISLSLNTALQGTKPLLLTEDGIVEMPAFSAADTNSRTLGIGAVNCIGQNLVRKIASRRVAEARPRTERRTSMQAERQLNDRLNSQAAELVATANEQFESRLRAPLKRRGAYPDVLRFVTSDRALQIKWTEGASLLGAPTPAPPVTGNPDLAIRVHESMLNSLAEEMLGGHRFDEQDMRELLIQLYGYLPERFETEEEKEPWSITFQRIDPVIVRMDNNEILITVRGASYTSGDRTYGAMNVTARYQIEITPLGMQLTRIGDIEVLPPGFAEGQRLGVRQQSLRSLLMRRFGNLFTETFETTGFIPPEQWVSIGELYPTEAGSSAGWLSINWGHRPITGPDVARVSAVLRPSDSSK